MIAFTEDCCDPQGDTQRGIPPALARRARALESSMAGERATERDWRILLGRESGALSWVTTQRLLACVEAALTQPGSRLDCR